MEDRRLKAHIFLGMLLFAGFGMFASAQDGAAGLPQNLMDPVGIDDLLYLSVYGAPELTHGYRVGTDGAIHFPYATLSGVPVVGKTPDDIGLTVAKALTDAKIYVRPVVTVSVLDYRSKRVNVSGSFHVPATVQAVGDFHLLDAITKAQGALPEAGNDLIVTRKNEKGEAETLHINYHTLMKGSDPTLNIALHGGEQIQLPESGRFYILGNVKTPGAYAMNNNGSTTVMQAVALSQGEQYYSQRVAYVFRENQEGKRVPIEVPLQKIMHRQSDDVAINANDVLYIPESRVKHISAQSLDHFISFSSSFLSSTMSGLIVFH